MRNMIRQVNSMNINPLSYFFGHKTCSLVRVNAVWKSMKVDKAFCEPKHRTFGRSIIGREGKSISTISIYASKDKAWSFLWWKQCSILNISPDHRLITLGMVPYWGPVLVSLLEYWAFCRDCSQISLGEWKSMLLSICITSIPATLATLCISLIGQWQGWLKKGADTIYRQCHLTHLMLKSSSVEVIFDECLHSI